MSDSGDVVVYDFDGTLVEGDIGAAFIHYLLKGWRRAAVLPIAPVGFALMRFDATRAAGVGLFLRAATAGRRAETVDAMATRFAECRPLRRRERELGWLAADLAAGHRVVVATGAFETLARVMLRRLGLEGRVALVASRLRPAPFGLGIDRHCNGEAKVRALAEDGFPPPLCQGRLGRLGRCPPVARGAGGGDGQRVGPQSRGASPRHRRTPGRRRHAFRMIVSP